MIDPANRPERQHGGLNKGLPKPRRNGLAGAILPRRAPSLAKLLPVYRALPEPERLSAIDRNFAVMRHGDWYLIAPDSLDTAFYEKRYACSIVRFPDFHFASVHDYSRLLLTDVFYETFSAYDFMLITQDDVFAVRDNLAQWLASPYDFVGAPWPDGWQLPLTTSQRPGLKELSLKIHVGNGGFSLRRIQACRRLFEEFAEERQCFHDNNGAEDFFFGLYGLLSRHFRLPNLRVAADFAWETHLPRMHAICSGELPMAVHAYRKFDPEFFYGTILPSAMRGYSVSDPPFGCI